jgi:hypothetical protein
MGVSADDIDARQDNCCSHVRSTSKGTGTDSADHR